jgi:sulfide:quinone oxidoreductase
MTSPPPSAVIAGAGVAGLEAAFALRELLGPGAAISLVGGCDTFHYKPLAVGEPFGLGHPHHHAIAPIAANLGMAFVHDTLTAVDPRTREIRLASGSSLGFEPLLVAVGAPTRAPSPFGVLFERAEHASEFDDVLADLRAGLISHVAFALPASAGWPLPAYELALMTAAWGAAARPGGVRVTICSHEATPLALFGSSASTAVAGVLEHAGIAFLGGEEPLLESDVLVRVGHHQLQAERIILLPEHVGPRIAGLPADAGGFVRVDPWGRVAGLPGVYAVGDAAAHPVKHGGLAAQQAVTAARAVAFDAGLRDRLEEPRPILRGLLRTVDGPLYLRAALADEAATSTVSREPLWWPPSKIAAPRLTSYLGRIERARAEGRVLAGRT